MQIIPWVMQLCKRCNWRDYRQTISAEPTRVDRQIGYPEFVIDANAAMLHRHNLVPFLGLTSEHATTASCPFRSLRFPDSGRSEKPATCAQHLPILIHTSCIPPQPAWLWPAREHGFQQAPRKMQPS